MRTGRLTLLSGAVCATVSLSGMAGEMSERRISEGHTIYQLSCSVCHGDKGDGKTWATRALDPSPEDFTAEPDHFNMEELEEHISEGCHGTAMQPFKYQLYEQEIEAVSAHILVNLLGWTVGEVNADLEGEPHAKGDHGSDGGSDDEGTSRDGYESHADKSSRDDGDFHADGGGCKPWNLEGVRTVAVKGRKP